MGHATIVALYLTINLILTFTNISYANMTDVSKRCGWYVTKPRLPRGNQLTRNRVAVANLAFIVFLALKNTPLAFLTAYSYERLNVLHQVAGYATVFWAILHAVLYLICWRKSGSLDEMADIDNVMGVVAGFGMLIIFVSSILLRKLRYEVFYVIHITMFMLVAITVGLHRPDFSKKTVIIPIFFSCLWVADRIIRSARMAFNSFGNNATLIALPNGGTRVVVRRSPWRSTSGTHAFLWLPRIRATETHPFTIVSTNPLEFVVAGYDGFTRDLHQYALRNPGIALKASVDGPYGTLPNFNSFDKVVLVAGGSGASFTFGVALEMLRKHGATNDTRRPMIDFLWVVRDHSKL